MGNGGLSLLSEARACGVRHEVQAWQARPLEAIYAVLWLDALMVKIRHEGVVQNKAVYVVIRLRLDGTKEVLGLWIEGTEGAKFWLRVLSELRNRGLQDVLIACCDGLKGFPPATNTPSGISMWKCRLNSSAELNRCTNVIAPFERARATRLPCSRAFRR